MSEKQTLVLGVRDCPKPLPWVVLSLQHVFAMFGATVLVPIIVGLPISVALFASGLGTLTYIALTKAKVPVYLGSSFAYISAIIFAKEALGGDISAAQTGLVMVGLVYVLVALLIKFLGKAWINKLLPPIVIGPMIAIIGLGLAGVAVNQIGLNGEGSWQSIVIAAVAFTVSAFVSTKAKGFFKMIPFILGILAGYLVAFGLGQVDLSPLKDASFLTIPDFKLPFRDWNFYFGPEMWAIVPVAIVTISEHIGDHKVLGKIVGQDFLQDPGLDKTLIGDGVATALSALLGGPANTTYGENTGVVGMTKVASVWVIGLAAVFAIALSFLGTVTALISTIPSAVLGGMSVLLFGVIASNGIRVLIEAKVDFTQQRNLIIASAMLVLGLGGAVLELSTLVTLSGTALAALVGVVLNLVLPKA
ncbi:MAG: NCS2 family nucleobase:cation symporter [Erysipelotrichia bacterium]|jgi:uracil permease|nr:NCS2 family nucleobase:cation symporter [Erysipelotrichia bacterium]